VATVILVRHGRTTANADGVLAGRTPGVALDEHGRTQAKQVAERLAALPYSQIVSSPLQRCLETAEVIAAARPGAAVFQEERLTECGYGDWTGRSLKELTRQRLWRVVQAHPSAAVFPGPGGEAMRDIQARAVAAVRDWNARVVAEHGESALWVACTHGDVIKAIVADALGLHLDLFQRLAVDPAGVSLITYTELRPFLLRLNDTGSLEALAPRRRLRGRRRPERSRSSDAAVGGGAGNS
jgi:probable phosphomutase (TIGR03848 family)